MRLDRKWALSIAMVGALLLLAGMATATDIPLKDWPVPGVSSGTWKAYVADIGNPGAFNAITPCRLADTRTPAISFPAQMHPPSLTAGVQQNWGVTLACGVPAGASAVSANFTAVNTAGGGFLKVWPYGGTMPSVSTLNYTAGQTVANAAIVPLSNSGTMSLIAGVSGTDMIMDVNGYFTNKPNTNNQFIINGTFDAMAAIVGFNYSNVNGSHAVGGFEGGTGVVHGVQGEIGTGAAAHSSGVHGIDPTTAASTYGVFGETASANIQSAGTAGLATAAASNAGRFENSGAGGMVTFLATNGSPGTNGAPASANYGVWVYNGHIYTTGNVYGSTKNFVAPHPNDPAKEIVYTSVEAPTADIYFRGSARLVNGMAVIQVPEHFRLSARDDTYQTNLTLVRARGSVSVESEGPEGIVVRGPSDAMVHYVVYAERSSIEPQEPVRENIHFNAAALSRGDPKGLPETYQELLVRNGTLNRDLTLNKETAVRLGWTIPGEAGAK